MKPAATMWEQIPKQTRQTMLEVTPWPVKPKVEELAHITRMWLDEMMPNLTDSQKDRKLVQGMEHLATFLKTRTRGKRGTLMDWMEIVNLEWWPTVTDGEIQAS